MAKAGVGCDELQASALIPSLSLGHLTPAVVDVRKGLAEIERISITEVSDRDLLRRRARCLGMHARLILVTHPKYHRHSLIDEAVRMRERLAEIERANSVEAAVRRETDFRWARARFLGHQQS